MSSEKEKAIKLRKKGLSYSQILEKLSITSKGTLSYWFKDIKLSKKERKRLEKNKKLAQERGLLKANKNKKERIKKENKKAYKQGNNLVKKINERELFLIGASLYWAEGTKRQDSVTTEAVEFSNSDPEMIKIYLKFIRKILKPEEKRIRSGIYLHDNVDEEKARNYWSKITKLPKDRFFIVNSLSKASNKKRPKKRLPYGTLKITISNRKFFYKIKGVINAISNARIK